MSFSTSSGPLNILIAAFFFACMNLGVRELRDSFPPDVLIFYRSVFQVLVLSYQWRLFLPKSQEDLKRKLVMHFARGVFGVSSMLFLYASMQRLPLGMASLLTMSSVFWATLSSSIFLKEALIKKQMGWGAVALAGIILAVIHPGQTLNFAADGKGILCGLLAGLAAGIAFTVLRSIRKTVDTLEIVFYFGWLGVLITGPMAVMHFQIPTTLTEVLLIAQVSICATLAQLFMTQGFKDTPAGLASLINLQQTTFSVILGIIFLSEWPTIYFYVGALLVFLGLRNLIVLNLKK